jgi:rhodanese-related sulfurtransferase
MAKTDAEFETYLQELSKDFEIEQLEPDSANLSKAVILDTREQDEYEVSRIKNAIWVGYDDFDLSRIENMDPDQEIIVYCSVGYRSSKIGLELIEAGYTNVKNLYGGIFLWANMGRPLFHKSSETKRIHAYNRKWGRFITNPDLEKIY